MSTSVANRSRQPVGTPVGGQFAAERRPEAAISLAPLEHEAPWGKRFDTLEQKLAAYREEMERGVADLATDENWHHYLQTMAKFHHYSFGNQLMIAIQRPGATRVAGYNRWLDVNRQVRKGEKGIAIWAPKTRWVTEEDASGNPVRGADGKVRKKKVVAGFTTATVFDISQTEGDELPEGARKLTTDPPAGYIEDLTAAVETHGFTVSYEEMPGSANGYTAADGSNRVVVDSRLSPGQRAKTLAHELGHIVMGHTGEDRRGDYHTGHGGQRGAMEVEAESFAYALCRTQGMDASEVGGYSYAYVAGWGGGTGTDAVRESADAVSKALKTTLAGQSWSNIGPDPVRDAPRKEREPRPRGTSRSKSAKSAYAWFWVWASSAADTAISTSNSTSARRRVTPPRPSRSMTRSRDSCSSGTTRPTTRHGRPPVQPPGRAPGSPPTRTSARCTA